MTLLGSISNHKNAPRDILMTESRLNKLHNIFKREKRNYTKTNDEYWQNGT